MDIGSKVCPAFLPLKHAGYIRRNTPSTLFLRKVIVVCWAETAIFGARKRPKPATEVAKGKQTVASGGDSPCRRDVGECAMVRLSSPFGLT